MVQLISEVHRSVDKPEVCNSSHKDFYCQNDGKNLCRQVYPDIYKRRALVSIYDLIYMPVKVRPHFAYSRLDFALKDVLDPCELLFDNDQSARLSVYQRTTDR